MENNDYIPFGDEWKSEMKKLKKEVLIDLLSNALKENLKLKNFKNAIVNVTGGVREIKP